VTGSHADCNGNFHGDDGRFISIRDYVERIFDEKDKLATSQRTTLESALIEARSTTDRAMVEAKTTVENRLIEAKAAADAVTTVIVKRLENLEAGGAPFASRLDDSLNTLKNDVINLKQNLGPAFEAEHMQIKKDVAVLNDQAVRTTVLDALRSKDLEDARSQKRQIRNLYYSTGAAILIALVNIMYAVVTNHP
jgi:hypothetical protein